MSIKALFFDIDWTLYDHEAKGFDSNSIKAIRKLANSGIDCFLSTARTPDSMEELGVFDLDIPWRGYINSAGAVTVLDGKIIKEFLMEPKDVDAFFRFVNYLHLSAEILHPTETYFFGTDTPYSAAYYKTFKETRKPILPFGQPSLSKVTGFNLFVSSDYDALFARRFPNLVFRRYAPFGVDVMPCHREKGDGIKAILDALGYKKEEALAFGDSLQDIPMKTAAHFIAMGNAPEEVKAAADEVTLPVGDSGVAHALEQRFAQLTDL